MPDLFFTIGHSNRTVEAFCDLLRESAVDLVVDVRSIPRSRANPQFNGDALSPELAVRQVGYRAIAALGGRRGRSREVDPKTNGYWTVEGFHNYADYALTASFEAGLSELKTLGATHRCAIMCAEAVWWRCHRRIITDYLLAGGDAARHILGAGKVDEARMTPGAEPRADGSIVYPAKG